MLIGHLLPERHNVATSCSLVLDLRRFAPDAMRDAETSIRWRFTAYIQPELNPPFIAIHTIIIVIHTIHIAAATAPARTAIYITLSVRAVQ